MEQVSSDTTLPFEVGSEIAGRYILQRVLGAGGMGQVVQVLDRTLDNDVVALKLLFPHLVKDEVVFARFRNEVLVARQLSHPNIVRLYDFGEAGKGYYYISMEYVAGKSLGQCIKLRRREPITFEDVVHYLYEISLGLIHAHHKGIIHRDIKPDNILISDSKEVKITDFGLARSLVVDKGFTQSGEAVGTPYYMAPEQIRGDHVDGRADIYALGIMCYELVTGRRPFHDDAWFNLAAMHLKSPLPDFRQEVKDIPEWFYDFTLKATEKDPDNRFQTVEDFAQVLTEFHPEACQTASYIPMVFPTGRASARKLLSRKDPKKRKKLFRRALALGAAFAIFFGVLPLIPALKPFYGSGLHAIGAGQSPGTRSLRELVGIHFPLSESTLAEKIDAKDLSAVALLVRSGVSANITYEDGSSGLHHAVRSGDEALVKEVLRKDVTLDVSDTQGVTPLMIAAEEGFQPIAQRLLESGAGVNVRDKSGKTALMYAIAHDHLGVAQLLVEKGAYVNLADNDGVAPLLLAVKGKDTSIAQVLLRAKADVNVRDGQGWTPLMLAAAGADEGMVRILVDGGADASLKNSEGRTAADYASRGLRQIIITPPTSALSAPGVVSTASRVTTKEVSDEETVNTNIVTTRLRQVGDVDGTWVNSRGGVTLQAAKVKLKNFGSVTAEEVKVQLQLPSGRRVELSGPQSIERNNDAQYSLPKEEQIERAGRLQAVFWCKNCLK